MQTLHYAAILYKLISMYYKSYISYTKNVKNVTAKKDQSSPSDTLTKNSATLNIFMIFYLGTYCRDSYDYQFLFKI